MNNKLVKTIFIIQKLEKVTVKYAVAGAVKAALSANPTRKSKAKNFTFVYVLQESHASRTN
jgi:hypothetical protein